MQSIRRVNSINQSSVIMELLHKLKRVITNPSHYVGHYYRLWKDQYLEYRENAFFESLKDKHKGQCGFVIGNGPSLSMSDLDLIKNEVSIGSNKIYMAYPKTRWRPTYYSVIDAYVARNIRSEIMKQKQHAFFPDLFSEKISYVGMTDIEIPNHRRFHFLPLLSSGVWEGSSFMTYDPGFSDDIKKGLYTGENVTYFNIQLLAYMGCNPIVLLGTDFSFAVPKPVTSDRIYGEVYESSGESNHFIKDYRAEGEKWTQPRMKEMQLSFSYAEEHLRAKGISLLNASRTTKLKDVPKVSLEKVLQR